MVGVEAETPPSRPLPFRAPETDQDDESGSRVALVLSRTENTAELEIEFVAPCSLARNSGSRWVLNIDFDETPSGPSAILIVDVFYAVDSFTIPRKTRAHGYRPDAR